MFDTAYLLFSFFPMAVMFAIGSFLFAGAVARYRMSRKMFLEIDRFNEEAKSWKARS